MLLTGAIQYKWAVSQAFQLLLCIKYLVDYSYQVQGQILRPWFVQLWSATLVNYYQLKQELQFWVQRACGIQALLNAYSRIMIPSSLLESMGDERFSLAELGSCFYRAA